MEVINVCTRVILGIVLFLFSIIDIKKREISNIAVIAAGILFIILLGFNSEISMVNGILGMVIGGILYVISKATHGKIGVGDSFIFCISGLGIGIWNNIELLMCSLFLSAIYSIFLLTFRHANRQMTIPFIPFIFLGYLSQVIFS